MIFVTMSGSTYEVDEQNKQIRRLKGQSDPTPRQGEDGRWKPYQDLSEIKQGEPVFIVWTDDVKAEIPGGIPGTLTSPVVSVMQTLN